MIRPALGIPVSLRHPVLWVFVLIMTLVGIALYAILVDSQRRIIEHEAIKIAEVVSHQALAARSVYSGNVAEKLRQDGFGAHPEFDKLPGHVPLPAQFLKLVGKESSRGNGGLYRYRPISKWNLEPTQGLNDDFQRWGWEKLEAQDVGAPQGPRHWRPAWRVERTEGIPTLRYLRADPAGSAACVVCHNEAEREPRTVARRVAAGVPPGKQWRQHQLLGAIEVNVPMQQVEALAASHQRSTIFLVLAIAAIGFAAVAVYAYYDIRRERVHAARFEQLSESLEERVRERTAALERANRELESYAYTVSHDLRSPLGVISGFSHVLAKDEAGRLSAEGRRQLGVIEGSVAHLVELVDDLLALANVNRATVARRPLDLRAMVATVLEDLQPRYPQTGTQLGPLPHAEGDATLVRQALVNLIDNAFKYSSRCDAPRVEVGWSNSALAYFVRDNGIGFDLRHAGRVFKPFERLHASGEFSGTGIGLAIVKGVVERHGGRVWAESKPGAGSTFWFTLPRAGRP